MALFGSSRDFSFVKQVNKELLNDIIQQEIDYYKYYLPETKAKDSANLYGEASAQKTYHRPVRVSCLIERQEQMFQQDDQFGIDVSQQVTFRFFKPILKEIGLVVAGGDIIEVRGRYFEIDSVIENQFYVGKDNDYGKSVGAEFGDSVNITAMAHLARVSRLQIEKTRG